jgi:hypothetical protein
VTGRARTRGLATALGLALLAWGAATAVAQVADRGAADAPEADPAAAAAPEEGPAPLDASELLARAAASTSGERTYLDATLSVVTSRLGRAREYRFRLFEDRPRQRAFLQITQPERDAGTRYLWLAPVAWTHVPADDVTRRLTRDELAAAWLESRFTLDDVLLRGAAHQGVTHRVLRVDATADGGGGGPVAVIESIPAVPDQAPWSRILRWVEVERGNPLRAEYYDRAGELARVLRYGDIRPVGDRFVPHLWVMGPEGERKRVSRIAIRTIRFDADFEEVVFTTRHLTSDD